MIHTEGEHLHSKWGATQQGGESSWGRGFKKWPHQRYLGLGWSWQVDTNGLCGIAAYFQIWEHVLWQYFPPSHEPPQLHTYGALPLCVSWGRYKGAPLLTWIGFSYCCFTSSLDDKTFRWSSSNFFKLVLDSVRIISRLILESHRIPPLVDTLASCADQRVDKSELAVWLSLYFPPLHWTETWALNSLYSPSSWKTASLHSTFEKAARSTYNFVYWVDECQKKSTHSKGCSPPSELGISSLSLVQGTSETLLGSRPSQGPATTKAV